MTTITDLGCRLLPEHLQLKLPGTVYLQLPLDVQGRRPVFAADATVHGHTKSGMAGWMGVRRIKPSMFVAQLMTPQHVIPSSELPAIPTTRRSWIRWLQQSLDHWLCRPLESERWFCLLEYADPEVAAEVEDMRKNWVEYWGPRANPDPTAFWDLLYQRPDGGWDVLAHLIAPQCRHRAYWSTGAHHVAAEAATFQVHRVLITEAAEPFLVPKESHRDD